MFVGIFKDVVDFFLSYTVAGCQRLEAGLEQLKEEDGLK